MGTYRSSAAWPTALAALLLAGCPTVDLGDTPSDIGLCNPPGGVAYFTDVIWPEFIRPTNATQGCTKTGGCHNEAGGNGLSFRTQPVDNAFNYRQAQLYLNCGQPMSSELLTRPLAGIDAHGGMDIYNPGDPQVQLFLDWFM
jgi:hypothetical protein